jgi:hypothetical protein
LKGTATQLGAVKVLESYCLKEKDGRLITMDTNTAKAALWSFALDVQLSGMGRATFPRSCAEGASSREFLATPGRQGQSRRLTDRLIFADERDDALGDLVAGRFEASPEAHMVPTSYLDEFDELVPGATRGLSNVDVLPTSRRLVNASVDEKRRRKSRPEMPRWRSVDPGSLVVTPDRLGPIRRDAIDPEKPADGHQTANISRAEPMAGQIPSVRREQHS